MKIELTVEEIKRICVALDCFGDKRAEIQGDAYGIQYWRIRDKSKKYNEDWSAFLSVGGNILDNDDFDREHKKDSYLELSYEFCKKHFNKDGWSDTKRIKNGGELI